MKRESKNVDASGNPGAVQFSNAYCAGEETPRIGFCVLEKTKIFTEQAATLLPCRNLFYKVALAPFMKFHLPESMEIKGHQARQDKVPVAIYAIDVCKPMAYISEYGNASAHYSRNASVSA